MGGENSSLPGYTLYTFTVDAGGTSQCDGGCATTWPPLVVDSADDIVAPAGVNLGTLARNDGRLQVTLNGDNLYFFANDNQAGDTIGDGVNGVWFVAELSGTGGDTGGGTGGDTGGDTGGEITDYGVTALNNNSATIWFLAQPDWPTTGTFYLCKDGEADCYPAEFNGDRWEYDHTNFANGQTYNPQLKVPGVGSNDFPTFSFSWDGGNVGVGDTGGDTGGNAGSFAHLDWEFNSHNSTENQVPHNENAVGPAPHMSQHLKTPENGSQPTIYGFAFDLNGSTFTWTWGPSIIKQAGDSGLEVYCSEDDGMTYEGAAFNGGTATVQCSEPYIYFFRYDHPTALNNNNASGYIYTGSFTTEGGRLPVVNGRPQYESFSDGSANWMRFRHPISGDGTTAAVLDAQHNNDSLRFLDRYTIWVDDSPGNVSMQGTVTGDVLRNEAMRSHGGPNGQQFFAEVTSGNLGWGDVFSYGQVIQFEISAIAGASGAQTYNDFSYYTVGQGWGAYGDVRLNSAGKAGTTMWFSDSGAYSDLEYNATFTQPLATVHKEQMVDDFIVGHHLFHGVDPRKQRSSTFDDPDVQIGGRTCGGCHFRDGRGSEVIQTAKGPRLPMPTYGVKLLEAIEGRQTGFAWDGSAPTVRDQIINAFENDHNVDFSEIDAGTDHPVVDLITAYTELLTVPNRDPGAYDDPTVVQGDKVFNDIGCASCHTPVQKTRADVDTHLRNLTIRPYTDMKLWDLGEGDFRTPALWGLGHNLNILERNGRDVLWMHDGASTSLEEAIQRHGGDASGVRSAYNGLSNSDKSAVKAFVKTL
ncbi:hypothetical protein NAF29_06785 [Echinimonas agarilytica]|uniref:Cytochrome c domain-containing protein n=1 Tax=Echinimonas agarilytica TaxID=1215918 RepID=A0AA42B715_9GAMM|nr:hypothetical protein [Echinimonas agarilytica]